MWKLGSVLSGRLLFSRQLDMFLLSVIFRCGLQSSCVSIDWHRYCQKRHRRKKSRLNSMMICFVRAGSVSACKHEIQIGVHSTQAVKFDNGRLRRPGPDATPRATGAPAPCLALFAFFSSSHCNLKCGSRQFRPRGAPRPPPTPSRRPPVRLGVAVFTPRCSSL